MNNYTENAIDSIWMTCFSEDMSRLSYQSSEIEYIHEGPDKSGSISPEIEDQSLSHISIRVPSNGSWRLFSGRYLR